jgi:hypothetical protein
MTDAQSNVLMVDPTAKLEIGAVNFSFGPVTAYRVAGDGWKTLATYTADSAWQMASAVLAFHIMDSIRSKTATE